MTRLEEERGGGPQGKREEEEDEEEIEGGGRWEVGQGGGRGSEWGGNLEKRVGWRGLGLSLGLGFSLPLSLTPPTLAPGM